MKLSLVSKNHEVADVTSFVLEPEQPVAWQPGQYLHYTFPHPNEDDRGIERWFTISAAPFEKNIRITTRLSDHGSTFKKALSELPVGGQIEAEGPGGKFILDKTAGHPVLIAGGIGVTPYRSMLVQMDHDKEEIDADLLYANRDENFVFLKELEAIAQKHPGLHITKFVGDKKISKADLERFAANGSVFYVSGPEPMVEAYKKMIMEMGVEEERIKTDYFPGYDADH